MSGAFFSDQHVKNRRLIIERFRVEHGNKRVALLEREHILGMLAAIERPSAKRHWLKAIRGLLRAAVPTMRGRSEEGIAGIMPSPAPIPLRVFDNGLRMESAI